MNMNIWLFNAFFLVFIGSLHCEYPGRRHQILSQNQQERQRSNEQLERVFAEWARLRLQKQIHQQHQLQQRPPSAHNNYPQELVGPGFSFLYPINTKTNENANDPYEFAVQPFDSRYYKTALEPSEDIDDIAARYDNNESPYFNSGQNSMTGDDVFTNNESSNDENDVGSDGISLIPPPMHVNENNKLQTDRILHRNQMKQKSVQQQQDVLQKPLQVDFDNTMSLYIVALIAGLSCAFSTGLIALGLMYWTLYKKSKSADACDYACDYGVIGPRAKNLENSQNAIGDKKLAHSAQMFHYQHQKQQIIAMENRNAEMNHNEDDNDSDDNENDFTVYECPGLAEWDSGMEVKNPLFTEETPAATIKNEKAQPIKASK